MKILVFDYEQDKLREVLYTRICVAHSICGDNDVCNGLRYFLSDGYICCGVGVIELCK